MRPGLVDNLIPVQKGMLIIVSLKSSWNISIFQTVPIIEPFVYRYTVYFQITVIVFPCDVLCYKINTISQIKSVEIFIYCF